MNPGFISRSIRSSFPVVLTLVLLLSASFCFSQEQKGRALDIEALLKEEINFTTIDQQCNQKTLADQSVQSLIEAYRSYGEDEANKIELRSRSYLANSFIHWRQGKMSAGISAVKSGLKLKESGPLLVQLAKLLDATGKFEKATQQYQRAIPFLNGTELEKIQVRVTLMQSKGNVKPLIDLAKTKDAQFRNRAAVALAILGHEKDAATLFVLDPNASQSQRFRQQVRLAEWALRAKDVEKAQSFSWDAVGLAKLKRDRRYGLALLVESHRLDGSIQALIKKFQTKGSLTEDESFVLVELFRETKQYKEAINTFKSSSETWTSLLKRQLIGLYRESERNDDIENEFQGLIDAEPRDVSWPKGLSEHFLERGHTEKASQIWQAFIKRNSHSGDLLAAAEAMASLGLDDLAVNAAKKSRNTERHYTAGSLFLFELYLSRGNQEKAADVLDDLENNLPAKSLNRRDLADGYERLRQPKKALSVWKGLYENGVELGVDGEMRIAWLQQSVGQNEEALVSWYAMLEKTPATQRRLVEDRIMTLSAQLGRLGKTAVALEEKILNKTADEKDARMLIKIYTKAGDAGSAVEIIEEFFGDGNSDSTNIVLLQEKAQIFRFLGEYDDFERVTKKLAEVDSKHRLEHIQSLILNQIENSTVNSHDAKANNSKKHKLLKELIAEHNKYGTGESAREFEAGVLDLAGEKKKAIEVYRKALAENPNRGDNYLVMANLMKGRDKTKDAVRMFQYLAERTERDDLFVIAMDGLLNMQDRDPAILNWAKRITLERLTRKSDKSYLYTLLADLADDSRDSQTQIAALENSLSHANSRRATTLRELIVLTDPNSRVGGRPRKPNVAENLKYSRRLIALRQAFPPEVFVNMGKTFLSAGEPKNAQKAFTMAVDSTGRADLMVEAARQFENRNYTKEALAQYEKSLIANKGDLEIQWRLGQLKEQAGWNDAANQLYRDGLIGILSRHPIHVDSNTVSEKVFINSGLDIPSDVRQDPSKTDEYKRHYFVLRDGFIRTLPFEYTAKQRALAWFENSITSELKKIQPGNGDETGKLVAYPRLNVLSQFLRFVALSSGDYQMADRFDRQVLTYFPADQSVVKLLVEQRKEWGQQRYQEIARNYPDVSQKVKTQIDSLWNSGSKKPSSENLIAIKSGRSRSLWSNPSSNSKGAELDSKLSTIILFGDQKQVLETCKDLVKASLFSNAVLQAKNNLDDVHFKMLCQYIVRRVKGNPDRVAKVLGGARNSFGRNSNKKTISWMEVVDQTAGEPIVSYEDILGYLKKARYIYQLDFKYVLKNLTGRQRIQFLKELGSPSQMKQSATMKFLVVQSMLQEILDQPVPKEEQKVWIDLVKNIGQKNDQIRRLQNVQFFNRLGFCKENGGFVQDIALALDPTGGYTKPGSILAIRFKVAKGDTKAALNEWIDCYLKGNFMPRNSGIPNQQSLLRYYSDQFVESTFSDVLKDNHDLMFEIIEGRKTEADQQKKLLDLQLKLLPHFASSAPAFKKRALSTLAYKHPNSKQITRQLLTSLQQEGDTPGTISLLQSMEKASPEDKNLKRQLFQNWQKAGNPIKALAYRPKAPKTTVRPVGKKPGRKPPVVRRSTPRSRTTPQSELKSAVANKDEKKIRSIVRKMWQSVAVSLGQIEYSYGRDSFARMTLQQLINTRFPTSAAKPTKDKKPATAPKPLTLCQGLVQYSFAPEEFRRWIRALRADEIDTAFPIFQALAQSIVKHEDPAKTRDQLAASIDENRQGDKGLSLWLALLEADPNLANNNQLQRIRNLISSDQAFRLSQLLSMARIYSKANQMDQSLKMYRSALCSVIDRNLEYRNDRSRITALAFTQKVKNALPAAEYRKFLKDVLQLTKPPYGQGLQQAYAEFGMKVLPTEISSKVLKEEFGDWIRIHLGNEYAWDSQKAIQAAGLLKKVDSYPSAVVALRASMVPNQIRPRVSSIDIGVGYKQMLGISRWNQNQFVFRGANRPPNQTDAFQALLKTEDESQNIAWLKAIAAKLPNWVSDNSLDNKKVFGLAEKVLLGLVKVDEKADANMILKAVTGRLMDREFSVAASTANQWVKLSKDSNLPMDVSVYQQMLETRTLKTEQSVFALSQLLEKQGPKEVLQVGQKVIEYNLDNQILDLLLKASNQIGDKAKTKEFSQLKIQVEQARKSLASNRPKTPVSKKRST